MDRNRQREVTAIVTGIGLTGIALFLCVSLYTHSPYDAMDYCTNRSAEIDNKAGFFGAQLAHHAFCLYGVGAWVLTLFLLVFGGMMCIRRTTQGFTLRTLGAVLMTLLVCAWSGAMDAHASISDNYPAGPGGLVGGTFVAPMLVGYFGRLGVYIVLAVIGFVACFLIEQKTTEAMLSLLGICVSQSGTAFLNWVIGKRNQALNAGMQPAMAGVSAGAMAAKNTTNPPAKPMPLPTVVMRSASAPVAPKIAEPVAEKPALNAISLVLAAIPEERKMRVTAADFKQAKERALARANSAIDLDEDVDSNEDADEKQDVRIPKNSKSSEEEESDRRRQEALRQADEAEQKRLERERLAREQLERDNLALEKLEKERAAKDHERAIQQQKFEDAMVEASGANKANGEEGEEGEGEGSGDDPGGELEAAPPKPQLPVNYDLPKYDLLIEKDVTPEISSDTLRDRGATIVQTLWDFKIGAKLSNIQSGPAVTMYELELDPGIKCQRIVGLQDNLAMAMKAEHGVRIIAPIPGRNAIGLEIPNTEDHVVRMRPVLESPQFRAKTWTLPLILGRDAIGNPLVADLANMPHLLIAGTTGSGKSVCVNSIIMSLMLMRRPHEVKLVLVDPKQVEMTDFKGIPHLLTPVVTDMKLAAGVLTWAVQKMEQRYERMSRVGVRNIATFNKLPVEERLARLPAGEKPDDYTDAMPYIVVIVDEFADLMMTSGKEIEQAIARLAQKARAAGIHVILATQRPSADVVTGLIKTNLPCRICFQVKSKLDSRIILEQSGGEKLAGNGDMLFVGAGNSVITRAKGVYITDEEIKGVVKACKDQAEPIYSDEVERIAMQAAAGEDGEGGEDGAEPVETNRQAIELDEKFDEAVEVFLLMQRGSTSLLQRRMGLGYTRAAKLCDQMEARGIVGPDRGAKGRELIISQDGWDRFKRVRSNNNGSAWGPKGSKDNPGRASPTPLAEESVEAAKSGEEIDPNLLEQLEAVDGVRGTESLDEME